MLVRVLCRGTGEARRGVGNEGSDTLHGWSSPSDFEFVLGLWDHVERCHGVCDERVEGERCASDTEARLY